MSFLPIQMTPKSEKLHLLSISKIGSQSHLKLLYIAGIR